MGLLPDSKNVMVISKDSRNAYSGDVIIPSIVSYDGTLYSVTSIGEFAFNNCRGLKGIDIPSSVTSIDYAAFAFCDSLTDITIPSSVTSIGYGVFGFCFEKKI